MWTTRSVLSRSRQCLGKKVRSHGLDCPAGGCEALATVATRTRTPSIGLRELREELKELGSRFRGLSENDLFVLWFLLAYLVDEEDIAARGLVGGSGDKSVDAVVIDDRASTVFLVQGKFRLSINQKPEPRSDVVAFADLGAVLWGDRDNYNRFTDGLDPLVRARLDEARNRVQRRDRWKVHLFYATTGSCSKSLETEAKNIARNAKGPTEFDVLDGRAVLSVFRDYLDGVAPPVRSLDFPVHAFVSWYERKSLHRLPLRAFSTPTSCGKEKRVCSLSSTTRPSSTARRRSTISTGSGS